MKNSVTIVYLVFIALGGCANQPTTVYQQLGGKSKVNEIVENFITEIEYDAEILAYFEGANIDRFREKLSEQICSLTDGPCSYTGDSMQQVHTGLNITETHFNRTVDLLINAMTKADVPHQMQNKLLKVLAPTRDDMLYK